MRGLLLVGQREPVRIALVVAIAFAGCKPPPAGPVAVDEKPSRTIPENTTTANVLEASAKYEPILAGRIDNTIFGVDTLLKTVPGVSRLTVISPDRRPTHRIVHLVDWHYVSRGDFSADLRSQSSEAITDAEIGRRYAEFLRQVDAAQMEQMAVLRCLIRHHGMTRVYIEGLTERDVPILTAKVRALRKADAEVADLLAERAELLKAGDLDDNSRRIVDAIREAEKLHHRELLRLGAAGQMYLRGELAEVLPLEDEAAYAAANPVRGDGNVEFDGDAMNSRREAQARRLLGEGRFAFVILGAAHDLKDTLADLSDGTAEYIRIETPTVRRMVDQLDE